MFHNQTKKLSNGLSIPFLDLGSGPPMVLVHGYPLSHKMWLDVIPELQADYRTIVPDLRGFGGASNEIGEFSIRDLADDLALLLDELRVDEPVIFVGLSMGGYVAFEFWARHAKRLRELVLCDTRAESDTPEATLQRRTIADRAAEIGTRASVEGMIPKLLGKSALENPEIIQRMESMMFATAPSTIAHAQRAMSHRASFVSRLPEIQVPTTVIVGQEDVISTPEEMFQIATAIPGGQFVNIPDCGHMTPMERPEAFVRAFDDVRKRCA